MTQYSAFGTHGNGVNGPASSVSYGGAFTAGMAFEVTTSSGGYLYGYYVWRSDSGQSASAECALWLITAASTGTYQAGTSVSSSSLVTGTWNYLALGSPFALTLNTPYKAVYGLTGNFNDTNSGTGSFTGSYLAGITNGPLNVYSPPIGDSGTNPVPFDNSYQGTFGTAGSDPTADYPTTTDGAGANFWVDVLVGPAAATFTAPPSRPRGQAVNRASTY